MCNITFDRANPEYGNTRCQFFGGCTGSYFGPTNTINTKKYPKKNSWALFLGKPPKMHCNVTAKLLAPNGSNMTQNDPE